MSLIRRIMMGGKKAEAINLIASFETMPTKYLVCIGTLASDANLTTGEQVELQITFSELSPNRTSLFACNSSPSSSALLVSTENLSANMILRFEWKSFNTNSNIRLYMPPNINGNSTTVSDIKLFRI